MKNYHLVHSDDQWKLKKEHAERSAMVFEDKASALHASIEFMKTNGGSLKIHKRNNVIQEERTYPRSADPRRTKG